MSVRAKKGMGRSSFLVVVAYAANGGISREYLTFADNTASYAG